jgi:hypothetical protein
MLLRACVRSNFSGADERLAAILHGRGVTPVHLQRAIWLGCARKYTALLNADDDVPRLISSRRYFTTLVEEVAGTPVREDYWKHVEHKVFQLERMWKERAWGTRCCTTNRVAGRITVSKQRQKRDGGHGDATERKENPPPSPGEKSRKPSHGFVRVQTTFIFEFRQTDISILLDSGRQFGCHDGRRKISRIVSEGYGLRLGVMMQGGPAACEDDWDSPNLLERSFRDSVAPARSLPGAPGSPRKNRARRGLTRFPAGRSLEVRRRHARTVIRDPNERPVNAGGKLSPACLPMGCRECRGPKIQQNSGALQNPAQSLINKHTQQYCDYQHYGAYW